MSSTSRFCSSPRRTQAGTARIAKSTNRHYFMQNGCGTNSSRMHHHRIICRIQYSIWRAFLDQHNAVCGPNATEFSASHNVPCSMKKAELNDETLDIEACICTVKHDRVDNEEPFSGHTHTLTHISLLLFQFQLSLTLPYRGHQIAGEKHNRNNNNKTRENKCISSFIIN